MTRAVMIGLIVLFCLCAAVLIFSDNRQGRRFTQGINEKRDNLQPDTFVCIYCGKRQTMDKLSTAIHRMCNICADLFDEMQDD